jgi:hypothetical protein
MNKTCPYGDSAVEKETRCAAALPQGHPQPVSSKVRESREIGSPAILVKPDSRGLNILCRLVTNLERFDLVLWRKVIKLLSCSWADASVPRRSPGSAMGAPFPVR